jgi:hypothetical protein
VNVYVVIHVNFADGPEAIDLAAFDHEQDAMTDFDDRIADHVSEGERVPKLHIDDDGWVAWTAPNDGECFVGVQMLGARRGARNEWTLNVSYDETADAPGLPWILAWEPKEGIGYDIVGRFATVEEAEAEAIRMDRLPHQAAPNAGSERVG